MSNALSGILANIKGDIYYENGKLYLKDDDTEITNGDSSFAKVSDLFDYIHTKDIYGPADFISDGCLFRMKEEENYYSLDSIREISDTENTALSESGSSREKLINLYELMNSKTTVQIPDSGENINFSESYYYGLLDYYDLQSGKKIIDLVSIYGTKYSNVLNLNKIPETGGYIKLGIKYTKEDKTFANEIIFELEDTEFKNTTESSDVTIEYHDKCIRLFPLNQNIQECVISYCYLMYE